MIQHLVQRSLILVSAIGLWSAPALAGEQDTPKRPSKSTPSDGLWDGRFKQKIRGVLLKEVDRIVFIAFPMPERAIAEGLKRGFIRKDQLRDAPPGHVVRHFSIGPGGPATVTVRRYLGKRVELTLRRQPRSRLSQVSELRPIRD